MSESNDHHNSLFNADDWNILSYVHQMLIDGNVLNTRGDKPIVAFKYPDELQVNGTSISSRFGQTYGTVVAIQLVCLLCQHSTSTVAHSAVIEF